MHFEIEYLVCVRCCICSRAKDKAPIALGAVINGNVDPVGHRNTVEEKCRTAIFPQKLDVVGPWMFSGKKEERFKEMGEGGFAVRGMQS